MRHKETAGGGGVPAKQDRRGGANRNTAGSPAGGVARNMRSFFPERSEGTGTAGRPRMSEARGAMRPGRVLGRPNAAKVYPEKANRDERAPARRAQPTPYISPAIYPKI